MPAVDKCHPAVVRALQKAGYRVQSKPLSIRAGKHKIHIDIEARRVSNGRQSQTLLLVEVKCFPNRKSITRDLYIAVGQYTIYRAILIARKILAPLYLMIPEDVYRDMLDDTVKQAM
jgi:hypothetical protein